MSESNTTTNKDWTKTQYTGPGSVYRVFKQYEKNELNAFGEKIVCIKPEVVEKKIRIRGTSLFTTVSELNSFAQ